MAPELHVGFSNPQNGTQLPGPQNGNYTIPFNGTVWTKNAPPGSIGQLKVTLIAGSQRVDCTANGFTKTWSCNMRFDSYGDHKVTAVATGLVKGVGPGEFDDCTDTTEITVHVVDTVKPAVDFIVPSPSGTQELRIGEDGSVWAKDSASQWVSQKVLASASDHLGVKEVTLEVDGTSHVMTPTGNPAEWHAAITLAPKPIGPRSRSIKVTARDIAANPADKTVTFTAVDFTPPKFGINFPKDGHKHTAGQPLRVNGWARDKQSGVAKLEWRLDANQPITVQNSPATEDWDWSFQVDDLSKLTSGGHALTVQLFDDSGNPSAIEPRAVVTFEVAEVITPQVASDLVSLRAYLEDLLKFAHDHVNINNTVGGQLSITKLNDVLRQPFEDLTNALKTLGQEPVNQLRVAMEILRRYLDSSETKSTNVQMIAHWPFDEGEKTTAHDASGKGYHATLKKDTMWSAGRSGSTLAFNGVDDIVSMPTLPALTNNFTIAFWAKPDQDGTITLTPESVFGTSGMSGQRYAWGPIQGGTEYGTSDHTGVGISVGANGVAVYEHSDFYLAPLLVYAHSLTTWTHIAVIYDKKQPQLYVDGKFVKQAPAASGKQFVHAQPDDIGGMTYGYFKGRLDEVRLFDGALSPAEVALLASVRVPAGQPGGSVPSEVDYCQAAYEAILNRIGTSYEEIRLIRGAEQEARNALAERLGITLDADPTEDQLKQIYLAPGQFTEAKLETLFGMPNTQAATGQAASLHISQKEHLRARWRREDAETYSVKDAEQPVIDPDLIGLSDLGLLPDPTATPTFKLWTERTKWLNDELTKLKGKVASASPAETNLDNLFQDALKHSLADFDNLVKEAKEGKNIDADLVSWKLALGAFRRLTRLRELAKTNTVTPSEWDDVFSILLQVKKRGQYLAWRNQETDVGQGAITLSPDHFVVADEMPNLPRWRATYEQRLAWQDRLQSRIDQDASLKEAQAAALSAADQAALPVLRDALVGAWAKRLSVHPSDAAEFFTARLLVDFKVSGSQLTTRLLQAIETVQNLLFTLRTQQMTPGHPAADWKLAYEGLDGSGKPIVVPCEATHFAEEWQWMSSYDAWRGAMLVFYFPENLLLPTLRPATERTPAFRDFAAAVRAKSRLSRQDARAAVRAYQKAVCGLVVDLPMNEGMGQAAEDVSGNSNWAVLNNGAVWGTGELTGTVVLAGNAYLEITDDQSYSESLKLGKDDADFSVSFWFYLKEGFTGLWRDVMHKGTDLVDPVERTYAIFMMPTDNRLHYCISTKNPATKGNEGGISKADIALNTWTFVEYRKVGRKLQLYLNNVLDSEYTLTDASVASPGSIYIGRSAWRPQNDGVLSASFAIKNMQIYNHSQRVVSAQIAITDEHTDNELKAFQQQCATAFASYESSGQQIPSHLKELFYFVPMEAALRLQASREFAAALDWFETVYAYQFPAAERKIYRGLAVEKNEGGLPQRTSPHWLREGLSPHEFAVLRTTSNPYTRFTLMSMARCFIEFADAEFTADTGLSLARARGLYLNARELLLQPDLDPPVASGSNDIVLPNPILEALRLRVDIQLGKLRQGRNIAGMKRQVELPASMPTSSGLPQIGSGGQLIIPGAMSQLRPTPYYFRVLLERSKQLTGIAQQMEAAFLAALEKRDKENYDLLRAGYGLQLAQAGTLLQDRRKDETKKQTALAVLQRDRAKIQQDTYQEWIDDGFNEWETLMIDSYKVAGAAQIFAATAATAVQIAQAWTTAATASGPNAGAASTGAAGVTLAAGLGLGAQQTVIAAQTAGQVASLKASHERRKEEWELQKSLADQDYNIGDQQRLISEQHEQVVLQEGEIARVQANEAQAVANFLARKFTSAELYDWMSRVLGEVYSYFLQQATSTAQLAQNQLAFERQEPSPGFILADYWQPPSDGGSDGQKAPDRQGLTGSARLLQDITKLDQYAFETDKRKLNLMQTFSLAQLTPFEFNRLRETGVLPFRTRLLDFDQGFPGHYLRLIKRVRTSVVALIPPNQGIRATLIASGVSRAVTGGDVFQEITIRRDPEWVALTSPVNATGVFELDTQSEMLLPFEAMGVDTSWEFQLPKAANPFDFNSIADVLITIEYTALSSFDYRAQVIKQLKPNLSADRAFSLRDDFPDLWYQLHNPDDPKAPLTISFEITRGSLPPNLRDLKIQHLLVAFLRAEDAALDWTQDTTREKFKTKLQVKKGTSTLGGEAQPDNEGVISTRRGNGNPWTSMTGDSTLPDGPVGKWTLSLTKKDANSEAEANAHFRAGDIEDILFIITFAGRLPAWPE